jgi:pimeloyl-ACP methyl ester carboxylesterase
MPNGPGKLVGWSKIPDDRRNVVEAIHSDYLSRWVWASCAMNILLLHGLGRTPCSLFGLGAALRRAGHHTGYFGYSPTLESLPGIVARLVARLRRLSQTGPVGLAGHSLGGLLLRKALVEAPDVVVHRLVMLGTPNRPPRMAAYFWNWRLFRLITRDCGRFLASNKAILAIPEPQVPYTLIAGTAGPTHSRFLFGGEANDGIVAVSETRIRDDDSPLLFPVYHSFIMNDRAVQQAVVAAMMK